MNRYTAAEIMINSAVAAVVFLGGAFLFCVGIFAVVASWGSL